MSGWNQGEIKILLQLVARIAIPEEKVRKIILGGRKLDETSKRYLRAYNLATNLTQGEIAKKTGIDQGNLSRVITRWIEAGIIFAEPSGKGLRLQHVYPISVESIKKTEE